MATVTIEAIDRLQNEFFKWTPERTRGLFKGKVLVPYKPTEQDKAWARHVSGLLRRGEKKLVVMQRIGASIIFHNNRMILMPTAEHFNRENAEVIIANFRSIGEELTVGIQQNA